MEQYFKKYTINSLLISVLLLIISIFLMIKPIELLNFIIMMFAGVIAIDGIFHVISYYKVPKELKLFNYELIEGILQFILGIITLINPDWVKAFFPILIGMWIVLSSIIKFQFAINIKDDISSNWIIILTMSIITFILGLIIVFNPIGSVITITTLVGIILFVTELINIIEYIVIIFKLRK